MVQREIKQKTRIYGTVAALSAMILVGLIFVLGSSPGLVPNPDTNPQLAALNHFASYDELRDYIAANSQGYAKTYRGGPLDQGFFAAESGLPVPEPVPSSISGDSSSANSYSTTNIQVAGVDEADIVKTDGEYIYVASNDYMNNRNYVFILKADTTDPRVIAKITLENNTYLAGMFLTEDGSKLVVIGSQYRMYAYDVARSDLAMIYPYYSDVRTFITIYDVTDRVHPILDRNLTLSGSYFNSRMIGNYVYAVVSQSAYVLDNAVTLPKVYTERGVSDVPANTIYYADTVPGSFTFTSFVGFNVLDSSEQIANMTILMGGASTMYVSLDNIYVTYPNYSEQGEFTSIHRIHFSRNTLTPAAEGRVPGYVLSQYSMDENGEYFRLATTSQSDTTHNNVYVLNMNMTTVGKIEGLAKDERIYSARFMGDKAYIVTFRQTDPFFVVDLSNPFNPRVAGELKIPGFSSYLHPFDENHVIGLGVENNTMKLSLFDVTNVNSPTEVAKYLVDADYSYSNAMYEPKAFLFDKEKQLLVLPIEITKYGVVESTEKDVFVNGGFWQGAYVFKVSTYGFVFRGGISHGDNATDPYYYGYNYDQQVTRALYIGNTLYTISNTKVKLNSLSDLTDIAEVVLR